jgi:GNAT superfamily N-acetyltransferase
VTEAPRTRIEPLTQHHDRSTFSCGKPELDDYLKRFARQNDKTVTRTWVLVEDGSPVVRGYYAARAAHIICAELPEAERRRLPAYPVPTFHLARMAVDQPFKTTEAGKGQRLGELLLMHALTKATDASLLMGIFAVDVIAIDDNAAAFYRRYGFAPLLDRPRHLFLPLKNLRALLRR